MIIFKWSNVTLNKERGVIKLKKSIVKMLLFCSIFLFPFTASASLIDIGMNYDNDISSYQFNIDCGYQNDYLKKFNWNNEWQSYNMFQFISNAKMKSWCKYIHHKTPTPSNTVPLPNGLLLLLSGLIGLVAFRRKST